MNHLTPFERALKSSVENFEPQVSPQGWESISSKLGAKISLINLSKSRLVTSLSLIVVGSAIAYFSLKNTSTSKINQAKAPIENKDYEPKPSSVLSTLGLTAENTLHSQEVKLAIEQLSAKESEKTDAGHNDRVKNFESTDKAGKPDEVSEKILQVEKENAEEIYEMPSAGFCADKKTICVGEPVHFTLDNQDVPCSYLWDFGDGGFSDVPNPDYHFATKGNYEVNLKATSLLDETASHHKIRIEVLSKPKIDFFWKKKNAMNRIPEIVFTPETTSEVQLVRWSFGDKYVSDQQAPSHIYKKKGDYNVCLVVKNNNNCLDSVCKTIFVATDYNLLAPTAFSPNGDGTNDTFMPRALEVINCSFSMNIYEKISGKKVFTTSSVGNPWDGNFGGKNAPMATYVWVVVAKELSGEENTYSGTVKLLR